MTSIFDSRYKRSPLGLRRADRPTAMILGEAALADEIEKLCDELAQARRKRSNCTPEIRALNKERIAEQACTMRALVALLNDSNGEGASLSPSPAGGSFEQPAQSSSARSSDEERAISGEVAGSAPAARTINAGQRKALAQVIALIDKGECVALTDHELRLVDSLREVAHA